MAPALKQERGIKWTQEYMVEGNNIETSWEKLVILRKY